MLGGVRATENQDFKPSDVMGVGIDGSRACDAFGAASRQASEAPCTSNSAKEGGQAIELLYASLKDNSPLPTTTYVKADFITLDTFGSYKDKLCHK